MSSFKISAVDKKKIKELLFSIWTRYDELFFMEFADQLKEVGFTHCTKFSPSLNISDFQVPPQKRVRLKKVYEERVIEETRLNNLTMLQFERSDRTLRRWSTLSELLKEDYLKYSVDNDSENALYNMSFSGARGNITQVRQLTAMRGFMSDPSGRVIPVPILKNFREGLTLSDYIISAYGARKGVIDTALRTADAGYLTRRLVDTAHQVVIAQKDCGTKASILVLKELERDFIKEIWGRTSAQEILVEGSPTPFMKKGEIITRPKAEFISKMDIMGMLIFSPLVCKSLSVCQKCYGTDLSLHKTVRLGTAVGVIAGQSIGEPGTQLTMRTFHTGGATSLVFDEKREFRINQKGLACIPKNLNYTLSRNEAGRVGARLNKPMTIKIYSYENGITYLQMLEGDILSRLKTSFMTPNSLIATLSADDVRRPKGLKGFKKVVAPHDGHLICQGNGKNYELWVLRGKIIDTISKSLLSLNFLSHTKSIAFKKHSSQQNCLLIPQEGKKKLSEVKNYFDWSSSIILKPNQKKHGICYNEEHKKIQVLLTNGYALIDKKGLTYTSQYNHGEMIGKMFSNSTNKLPHNQKIYSNNKTRQQNKLLPFDDDNLDFCTDLYFRPLFPGEYMLQNFKVNSLTAFDVATSAKSIYYKLLLETFQFINFNEHKLLENLYFKKELFPNLLITINGNRQKLKVPSNQHLKIFKNLTANTYTIGSVKVIPYQDFSKDYEPTEKYRQLISHFCTTPARNTPLGSIVKKNYTQTQEQSIIKSCLKVNNTQYFLTRESDIARYFSSERLKVNFNKRFIRRKQTRFNNLVLDQEGLLLKKDAFSFSIHRATPLLITFGKDLVLRSNSLVYKNSPITFVSFEDKIKKEDLTKEIKKINSLLEAHRSNVARSVDVCSKYFFYLSKNLKAYKSTKHPFFEAAAQTIMYIKQSIITNVRDLYIGQGIEINPKHLELIISRTTNYVKVIDVNSLSLTQNDTNNFEEKFVLPKLDSKYLDLFEKNQKIDSGPFFHNELVPFETMQIVNKTYGELNSRDGVFYVPHLLGISRAARKISTFSSASFQQPSRVLKTAALFGNFEHMSYLKEKILIGRLIPSNIEY